MEGTALWRVRSDPTLWFVQCATACDRDNLAGSQAMVGGRKCDSLLESYHGILLGSQQSSRVAVYCQPRTELGCTTALPSPRYPDSFSPNHQSTMFPIRFKGHNTQFPDPFPRGISFGI